MTSPKHNLNEGRLTRQNVPIMLHWREKIEISRVSLFVRLTPVFVW